MEQLTEMDSNFLLQESARTPMHISPVLIYDPSGRKDGRVRFKEILTAFQRNLHKSRIFRRKLAGGALGWDAPYWVEDEHFDLEFHVRHIALPKPGDWRQFCILLARLQARGLDMKRPLWEAYVIEGLNKVEGIPENSFAIMLKVHHAAIDGISGAEIVTAIHSLTDEVLPPEVDDNWQGEPDPSELYIWSRAYLNNLQRPLKFVKTISHLVPAIIRAERESADPVEERRPSLTAKTRFNARISSARVVDALIMDLDEVKFIRKALGNVTINDVIVCTVGGALRKYLQSKGELPQDSLIAGAPINVRAERNSESSGNQISLMTIDMATGIADPVERLQSIHHSAQQSKAFSSALGGSIMMDVTETLIPQVMGWSLRAAMAAASRTARPMPAHVMISNVPGPQFPIYLAGAKVSLVMGMGPLLDMMGLFHAVLSGAGQISITFISCREMMPDPQFYKSCLDDAYHELYTAAKKASRRRKKSRGRKK
ncbi:MAG: wax ester/triacylglycerol synthase family O-acyltransferase [Halioglobus sp.]|nr:wax ester/triacylglycerol synthase family O-acyltransferase [Halioglobus sp.]